MKYCLLIIIMVLEGDDRILSESSSDHCRGHI